MSKALSGSLLNRQSGKVRRVLFCDDGRTVVVGGSVLSSAPFIFSLNRTGNFNHLILWDVTAPEISHTKIISLSSNLSTLDMTWRRDRGVVQLIVLSNDGKHMIFPTHYNRAENHFEFGDVLPQLTVAAHLGPESFKNGSITCCESTVASTTGGDVVVTEVDPSEKSEPFPITIYIIHDHIAPLLQLSAASLNNGLPLSHGSRITHLHLCSTTRILIFLLQESKMCVQTSN
jgi:hypothetical protein